MTPEQRAKLEALYEEIRYAHQSYNPLYPEKCIELSTTFADRVAEIMKPESSKRNWLSYDPEDDPDLVGS